MSTIQSRFGNIYCEKMGDGPPLIALHGGPGCESSYMIAGLKPLAKWRTVYVFDQYGCGDDPNDPETASFRKTVDHAVALIEAPRLNGSGFGMLGHSFGAQLAFGDESAGAAQRAYLSQSGAARCRANEEDRA